jgi:hypothetical protein
MPTDDDHIGLKLMDRRDTDATPVTRDPNTSEPVAGLFLLRQDEPEPLSKDLQLEQVMLVSRTGTRHLDSRGLRNGRLLALCGFSLHPDEGPFEVEALRDCAFCLEEAADARRKAAAAEALKQLREGFRAACEPVQPGAEASLQPGEKRP